MFRHVVGIFQNLDLEVRSMKFIKMNKKGWQIVDEQIRQARKDGHVAWTVHHEDGSVTLEISGIAALKLVKN